MDKKELVYTIDRFMKDFADSKKFFEKVESEFNSIRHLLTTKANVKQINDLKSEMEVLATKDDYKRIKELMIEFEGTIGRFRQEALIHSEILRRYDEVISEKASKFNLLELEGSIKLQSLRIDHVGAIEKRVDTIIARQEKQRKDTEARFDIIN
jgi:Zn-finger domain-containing protein